VATQPGRIVSNLNVDLRPAAIDRELPPRPWHKSRGIDVGLSRQFVESAQGSDASITIDRDRALAVIDARAKPASATP